MYLHLLFILLLLVFYCLLLIIASSCPSWDPLKNEVLLPMGLSLSIDFLKISELWNQRTPPHLRSKIRSPHLSLLPFILRSSLTSFLRWRLRFARASSTLLPSSWRREFWRKRHTGSAFTPPTHWWWWFWYRLPVALSQSPGAVVWQPKAGPRTSIDAQREIPRVLQLTLPPDWRWNTRTHTYRLFFQKWSHDLCVSYS